MTHIGAPSAVLLGLRAVVLTGPALAMVAFSPAVVGYTQETASVTAGTVGPLSLPVWMREGIL